MRFLIMAFAVSMAFGQTNRIFRLTQEENRQELEEIATVLRATGDIQQVSIDDINRTVTVDGTAGQIAMADWLIHQVDLPANAPLAGVHEYRPPAGSDDVVRVFYLSHASTPQELQRIVTTVRSVADNRSRWAHGWWISSISLRMSLLRRRMNTSFRVAM
jgi:hypothetical protein